MGVINKKSTAGKFRAKAHLNYMGGLSYSIGNPIYNLRMAAASSFFGEPQYYQRDKDDTRPLRVKMEGRLPNSHVEYLSKTLNAVDPREWRSMTPAQLMESAIDKALDFDAEETLKLAVWLRGEGRMRTTPQVILVRAARHPKVRGTGLIRKYAPEIIQRADEPAIGLAYQMERYGKPVPNSLKKAWNAALSRFSEYELAKYRMENRQYKTVDVVNMVHAKSPAVDALMKNKLSVANRTWEGIISAKGSNKDAWTEAVQVMGHMALLRNLRNLIENKVPETEWLDKLVGGVPGGKQFPFRYYSAYEAIRSLASPKVLDAVEACLKLSYDNLPELRGRVISLCDNSGSAWGTTTSSMGTMAVATIANLTGIMTAHCADEGYLGVFGDGLHTMPVRKGSSIFDQLDKANDVGHSIGQGTEHGIWLFWDHAIREKEHWDTVFVYSDMQAGHGGLYGTSGYESYRWPSSPRHIDVPKLVSHYRQKVNPNVLVFLVQVAGYQDTIMPEFYDKTYILGGWGDGIIGFAAEMAGLTQAQQ